LSIGETVTIQIGERNAGITDTILILIQLIGVSDLWTVVTLITPSIPIQIFMRTLQLRAEIQLISNTITILIGRRLTEVTLSISILISLMSVGDLWTVVAVITDPISILILVLIWNLRAEVQKIGDTITICIWRWRSWFTGIAQTISILISLIGVGDIDAVITPITTTISIGVKLLICLLRAEIQEIWNTITITIWGGRHRSTGFS